MIASATAHPIHLPHAPLLGLRPGATPPLSAAPTPGPAGRAGIDFFRADFHDARWIELDDTADAAELTREAAAADAALAVRFALLGWPDEPAAARACARSWR